METVKVKRKGQVTIPVKVRRRYEIEEGDLLTIEGKDSRTIIIKVKKLPEPGQPVGFEEQRKILRNLEKLRNNWR
ncbi:MAG: AbrB/MazE/SpoVT family DNA-binding domain-containing protein [Nitrososphaerales archaeon]